ncbi:hypothetical protein Tco_0625424 [Tanacetum coccineum]|uniref:Uncharacterized protein n=1 Tax=Tanacetum coccineum TaxID=301880 RepID=A0ABQ4WGU6_9ASTR
MSRIPRTDEAETTQNNMVLKRPNCILKQKKKHFLLLTGIGDEIYSTVDACNTVNEMWIAIERLQQGESLNVQDVKTNLFWEFGKFTSRDGRIKWSRITPASTRMVKVSRRRYLLSRHQNLKSNATSSSQDKVHLPTQSTRGTRTVGSPVCNKKDTMQLTTRDFSHYAKECRKPKRVKDYSYHKEKMMMCKQAEQGVQLQAEQADWLEDTDEEIDEQELEAHYSYMAKIQESYLTNLVLLINH